MREAGLYQRLCEVQSKSIIHNICEPTWASNFLVIVQMTPQWDGQAQAVLYAVLNGPYTEPKVAVAIDDDVNIYDPRDVFWAISTRVNPEKDVAILRNQRGHHIDISAPEVSSPEGDLVVRVGGKMIIDATKPALWRKEERKQFDRVVPSGANDSTLAALLSGLQSTQRSREAPIPAEK
jgi:UbiD family decarboxylase